MRLGIDNGNYYTKSSTGFKYMSGLKEDSTAVAALNRITYDGHHYTVGECRDAIEINKTSNSNMLIQSLPAIAESIKRNMGSASGMMPTSKTIELELGVGTPLKMYGKEAPKYRQYFIDQDLEYDWNGEKFHVLIKRVEVYPQGYAAYMANYNMFADHSELNVIDIGGGTDDAFMIRNGLPVTDTFRTLNDGVITLVNKCRDILEMDGIYISESQICNAIMDEDVFHVRKDQICEICVAVREEYISEDIIGKLKERKFDFSVPTLFIGGGAMLLEKFWKDAGVNVVGCLDELANAKAYEVLLNRPE